MEVFPTISFDVFICKLIIELKLPQQEIKVVSQRFWPNFLLLGMEPFYRTNDALKRQ